jgi:hypothetical protein
MNALELFPIMRTTNAKLIKGFEEHSVKGGAAEIKSGEFKLVYFERVDRDRRLEKATPTLMK